MVLYGLIMIMTGILTYLLQNVEAVIFNGNTMSYGEIMVMAPSLMSQILPAGIIHFTLMEGMTIAQIWGILYKPGPLPGEISIMMGIWMCMLELVAT